VNSNIAASVTVINKSEVPKNNLEPGIRNGVRAVIIRANHVLLLHKESPAYGVRYALPGGSQELGETLEATLQRECKEEIGTPVVINDLIHIADFFKPRETIPVTYRHVVEFLFSCSVPDDYQAGNGYRPDKHQAGVRWIPLERLPDEPLFPRGLTSILTGESRLDKTIYLGVIG
jgi:8-oxo-dGTP diphosphatase